MSLLSVILALLIACHPKPTHGDSGSVMTDSDNDGYPLGPDCDDTNPEIHPGADEVCDGVDNDCDGATDDLEVATWYADDDGDGYGDDADTAEADCDGLSGYVATAGDCDDSDASVNPAAPEVCDELDNDCDGATDEDDALDAATWYADSDSDTYGDPDAATTACEQPSGYLPDAGDCDDGDAAINPGADEVCDGLDNDCDGTTDDDDSSLDASTGSTWYADSDSDTYGDPDTSTQACDQPAGYTPHSTDCDDGDAAINPAADEVCNDLDDDCDGTVDNDDALDAATWYADVDGDAYGDSSTTTAACDQPTGYVADDDDCDDSDEYSYPGADETCDEADDDCDGDVDEDAIDWQTWYTDSDGDTYGDPATAEPTCDPAGDQVLDDTDCDDTESSVYPGADEYCNEIDDDCDGEYDEDNAVDALTWYADSDNDGYGDADNTTAACDQPTGHAANDADCDDGAATTYPGADETCDEADDDCDGDVDEDAIDWQTWYTDSDDDGYGDPATAEPTCDPAGDQVLDDTDCDDSDDDEYPGADEYCDGDDDDCDGVIDEDGAVDVLTWYADSDADGYGDAESTDIDCAQPAGFVPERGDCDDADNAQHPGADERCNAEDDDCDGDVDEPDALDASTWYADADGDAYGDSSTTTAACEQPAGYVTDSTDCDDAATSINPAATEVCDEIDNDCDGTTDDDDGSLDASTGSTWYADSDSDTYGDPDDSTQACDQPAGYTPHSTDCDDGDAAINPAATEVCNDLDDDCDGTVDPDDAADASTWFQDYDGDGYGADSLYTTIACEQPIGYVLNDDDCDSTDSAQYPGADEYCNTEDDDCDGAVDEDGAVDVLTWYADTDGDAYGDPGSTDIGCDQPGGFVADDTDCDDANTNHHPGADEYCDGDDDDCDGDVDEDDAVNVPIWYADADGDSYGDADSTDIDCDQPDGFVAADDDCDDSDEYSYPGADETCDEADDDCDGDVDEDAIDWQTWYTDSDGDTYGDPATAEPTCDPAGDQVLDDTDCDDTNATHHPGADEYCDGDDDDCDGDIDEPDAIDASTWYADTDSDSYGNAGSTTTACEPEAGYVPDDTDCDDTESSVYPGADEYCNEIDDDCDGEYDEDNAVDALTWYADSDADGYGDDSDSQESCEQPDGYVLNADDCDDADNAQYPGADEYCNAEDDDCDSDIDEDGAIDVATWYADADGDGYGYADSTDIDCDQPDGFVADDTDCDDSDASLNDDDSDADGYSTCQGDCDDSDDSLYPAAGGCPMGVSCADILELWPDFAGADGLYTISAGSSEREVECDMSTDGGGWTQIVYWNHESSGDTLADLEPYIIAKNMGVFKEDTYYVKWRDNNKSEDILVMEWENDVPNDGEVYFGVHYEGDSMEDSGTYFSAALADGTEEELVCKTGVTTKHFSSSERAYLPLYTCSDVFTSTSSWTWDEYTQHDLGDELTAFNISSFHRDNGGDMSYLYWFDVWVR